MRPPVSLTCWTCGEEWELPRRRGQYPTRCPDCTTTEHGAHRLRARAQALGLTAIVERHTRQGYVCLVDTPWHEEPVIVRDPVDLTYLQAELAAGDRQEPIAA